MANQRRNLSANPGRTRSYATSQTTGTDGSRRSTGTVRGQLRDSGFTFQFARSNGTVAGRAAAKQPYGQVGAADDVEESGRLMDKVHVST